jgi:hypothetical protein
MTYSVAGELRPGCPWCRERWYVAGEHGGCDAEISRLRRHHWYQRRQMGSVGDVALKVQKATGKTEGRGHLLRKVGEPQRSWRTSISMFKIHLWGPAQWLMPIILATPEKAIGRIKVWDQPGQKSSRDPQLNQQKVGHGGKCLSSQLLGKCE